MEPKRFEVLTEAISELLISKEMLFRTPRQMECFLKKEITKKLKELGIKKGFLGEEMDSFKQLTRAIVKRDQDIFDEYCHLTRNELISIGGYAKRLNRATKRADGEIQKVRKILSVLTEASQPEIYKNATIIFKEAKKADREVRKAERRRGRFSS